MKNSKKTVIEQQDARMLRQMKRRSWLLFSSFNMLNYQGLSYGYAMIPAINRFYPDGSDEKKNALIRSDSFFNCTYETAPFIMGMNAALEKENAAHGDLNGQSINAIKASLMGPMSAIGDSIFWGVVRTVAAAVGISLAMSGNFLGPVLFLVIYTSISVFTRYRLMDLGYTQGEKFIAAAAKTGIMAKLTFCATIVGMIMIGSMTASFVNITTPLSITMASGEKIVVQDVLDGIFKGILPLAFTFGFLALLRKKIKPTYLMAGTLVFGIVALMFGIL